MNNNTDNSDLLNWLGDKPELLEKLRRLREIEQDEGNGDIPPSDERKTDLDFPMGRAQDNDAV